LDVGAAVHDTFESTVVMGAGAPAFARGAVTDWLIGQVPDAVIADARLLVSELVSNTLHAALGPDAPLSLNGRLSDHILRLEVGNPGQHGTVSRRDTAEHSDEGGYGLQLVALLSARWGVHRETDTRVWFELATV
jgi:anti-sigma regulatory factor (Ser/Thr protein kinase)